MVISFDVLAGDMHVIQAISNIVDHRMESSRIKHNFCNAPLHSRHANYDLEC